MLLPFLRENDRVDAVFPTRLIGEVQPDRLDAGKPFDPVKYGKKEMQEKDDAKDNEHLGLRLVTSIIPDITYKYMYGQNTVFISLPVDGGR